MRKRSRVILATAALAAGILLFLPSLLTLQPALSFIRERIGGQFSGTLEATSCSLGWVQGLRCEDLHFHDQTLGIRLESPRLGTDKGVLLLLIAPSYLGEITLEAPTLTFLPPQSAARTPQPEPAVPDGQEPGTPESPQQKAQKKTTWWEQVSFRLKVHSGQLALTTTPLPARQLARRIELTGSLAQGTVHYDLQFSSPQQAGHLRASGFFNLPLAGQSLMETLVSQAEVSIVDMEIADFLELAAARSGTPRGQGVLNATVQLRAAGIEEFEAKGATSLRDVYLTGGPLGDDHPQLDRLNFTFSGQHRKGKGWRLSALELESEPVRLSANGSFDGNLVNLAAKGHAHLPSLATQIPRLLGLHEQTKVSGGTVGVSLDIAGPLNAIAIHGDCRTDHLSIEHNGHPYLWSAPLVLELDAEYSPQQTSIRTLRAKTPFFEAKGSGDFDDFTLQSSGDLEQMSQELGKIFALNYTARGRVELTATSKKGDNGGYRLESRLAIRDLALSRGKHMVLPTHTFHLDGKATTTPSFPRSGALHSLQVDAASWPGDLSLLAKDLQGNGGQAHSNCSLRGTVDLERLTTMVQGLYNGGLAPMAKGRLQLEGTGACEDGPRITVERLRGTIDRLAVTGAGYALQEPRVTFALGATGHRPGRQIAFGGLTVVNSWQDLDEKKQPVVLIDGRQRQLVIRHLGWASDRTTLDTAYTLSDWLKPDAEYSAAIRGETDTALLADLVRAAGWLPADLTAAGRTRGTLITEATSGQSQKTEVTLETDKLTLSRGKKQFFTDPHPLLRLQVQSDGPGKDVWRLPSFLLHTVPLRIEGAGQITRRPLPSLELQGLMTPDFTALTPLLSHFIGRETTMTGNGAGEFLLSLPLSLPVDMERLTFSAQLPVDALRHQGFGLRSLTLPVDCNRGKLRLLIDTPLDGGRVTLEPRWDLTTPQPMMTLAGGTTPLFKDVTNKPPVTALLGKMHPLFGILATPRGTIDLRLDKLSAVATEKGWQQLTYAAAIGVDRSTFNATGALSELLTLANLPQEGLRCRDREISCENKGGRLSCGPVRLLAGEVEILISGDMRPDGSLHYRVRLPVAKQLAERVQLMLHGEMTVEAEIGGTRTTPTFDQSAFLASLAGQLHQAPEISGAKEAARPPPQPTAEPPAPTESSKP